MADLKVNKVLFYPTVFTLSLSLSVSHTQTQSVTHVQVSHGLSFQCCTFLWICSNRTDELEGLEEVQARRLDFGS